MANKQGTPVTRPQAGAREPMHGPAGHRPARPPASQAEQVFRPEVDDRGAKRDERIARLRK